MNGADFPDLGRTHLRIAPLPFGDHHLKQFLQLMSFTFLSYCVGQATAGLGWSLEATLLGIAP